MKWFWKQSRKLPDYHIYTTEFDVECRGDDLAAALAPEEMSIWKAQIKEYKSQTEKYRTTASLLGAKAVDEIKAHPGFAASSTAVTLLVDHSGSLKGQKAILSCLAVEILADHLARLGLTYDILGFTTVDWRGGQSRQLWNKRFRTNRPGRLNDILHIVYRDTSETTPGAPYSILHMLRSDLLKENIDGEALFWASERLKNLEMRDNYIIVVSDGAPVDDSTLAENGLNFLSDHLKSVISDLQNTPGFHLAGVGIDCDLGDFYNDHVLIDRLDTMPEKLSEYIQDIFRA